MKLICPQRTSNPARKKSTLVAGAVIFGMVAIWVALRMQSASLERANTVMKAEIAATAQTRKPAVPTTPVRDAVLETSPQPLILDWTILAAEAERMIRADGTKDRSTEMRLMARFAKLSEPELIAALEALKNQDMPSATRSNLAMMLRKPLAEINPLLVLNLTLPGLYDEERDSRLQFYEIFGAWAWKDLPKATAWLDQQIAAGLFDTRSVDGVNGPRMRSEGALMQVMIYQKRDFDGVGKRLGALPVEWRFEITGPDIVWNYRKTDQMDKLAAMLRQYLPEIAVKNSINQLVCDGIDQSGYKEGTARMKVLQPTPAESEWVMEGVTRRGFIIATKRPVTRNDLDQMRDWIALYESPDSVNRKLGHALEYAAEARRKSCYEEAEKLVLEYHEASGNDDLLASFLSKLVLPENRKKALPLLEKITNPELREQLRKTLE